MKPKIKEILINLLQILISALAGAGATFGVMSCTVNSGNRETLERSPYIQIPATHTQSSNLSNYNNSNKVDTIKVIKESNTIYTND